MRENLHIRQSSAQAAGQAIKNKPATTRDTAGRHRRRPQAKPYKNKPATTRDTAGRHRQLSGAPSTYDREKKPDEEAAAEPVDCQERTEAQPR